MVRIARISVAARGMISVLEKSALAMALTISAGSSTK